MSRKHEAVAVAGIFLALTLVLTPAWAQDPGARADGPIAAVGQAGRGLPLDRKAEARQALPEGASQDWWSEVQKDIETREYDLSPQSDGSESLYQAPNRAHGFRAQFHEGGVRLVALNEGTPGWEWGLEYSGPGQEKPGIQATGNRFELFRGEITEWYTNSEQGIEQGFTVDWPLGEEGKDGQLHIDMKLTGTLHPKFSEDGQAIDFYDSGCVNILRYGQLKVTDATGETLPSQFEPINGGIRIAIDDAGATYPITVDPVATSPAWTVSGESDGSLFGISVATAGDVNGDGYGDVIVGARGVLGRAYLYLGSASGLSTSASWTGLGDTINSYYGYSVATAGDVNGDGYSDVIVGAPFHPAGGTSRGRAYLYLGSSSGLSSTASWIVSGDTDNASYGFSVATAGDVNGDGYSDVIVGACNHPAGGTSRGQAYLYSGSGSGLSSSASWTVSGDTDSADYGYSVATAGDVNGDGYSDVIVGAYTHPGGGSSRGRAYLYNGSASGLSASPSWTVSGVDDNDTFGSSVATAGDVNGDGYSDVIVGAYWHSEYCCINNGKAYLFLGSGSGLSTSASWTSSGDMNDAYHGGSVATAGDVNGDGYSDVIVGAFGYNWTGRAYLYLGSATGLSTSSSWIGVGETGNSYYGNSVSTAGDVNGDGYSDVIVGSPYHDGSTYRGRSYLYMGSASGLSTSASWTVSGWTSTVQYGYSVATAGDVNGDGYGDVIVAAVGSPGWERTSLYLGSASGLSTTTSWSKYGDSRYGCSIATAGDVNGDGYSDVIIGADSVSAGGTNRGQAYLYLGSASGLGTSESWTVSGDTDGAYYGCSVASAGDVNGDGYSDFIVGAYGHPAGGASRGRAYLYLGSLSGPSAFASWTVSGDVDNARYGSSVATAGDVNGDGSSDVIVGAYSHPSGGTSRGRVYLYFGSAYGLSTSPSWTGSGDTENAYYGRSAATAGDVNGDGYSDVVVGAYGHPASGTSRGRAYLYLGSGSGLSASASWTGSGDTNLAYYGRSVATATDVNGDGFSDVVVGAYNHPAGGTSRGRAYLYLGSASGLSASASWTGSGDADNIYYGFSAAAAGDTNGDGYGDVIVGAYNHPGGGTSRGRAYLYIGNGEVGRSISLRPQQRRANDSAPVDKLGMSESASSFRLASFGRTPFGRGDVKLELEVKALGTPFNGSGTQVGSSWADSGVSGVSLNEAVSSLVQGTLYHWRVRLRYNPATTPFQQGSIWFRQPWGGWQEADLRVDQYSCAAPLHLTNSTAVDIAPCVATGVKLTWRQDPGNWKDAGPAGRTYDVLRNGSAIQSAIAYGSLSEYTDTTGTNEISYTYAVRYNNGCGMNATTTGVSAADMILTAPVITAVTDIAGCVQSGVTVTYTAGLGATSHNLVKDGIVVVTGYASGATYNPGDGVSHSYLVRALRSPCASLDSNAMSGTDSSISLPAITADPSPATTCAGATAAFSVTATGASTYRWQFNSGSGWTDLSDDWSCSGTTSATLTLVRIFRGTNGYTYRCVATNACGQATSNPAALTVCDTPPSVGTLYVQKYGNNEQISWTRIGNTSLVDRYEVMRSASPAGPFDTLVGTATGNLTGILVDLNLEPPTAYYEVRAVKGTCNGPLVPQRSVWLFDEGAGSTAYDSVNSNHGQIFNATWAVGQGVRGSALSFNGTNAFVSAIYPALPTGGAPYTLMAWVRPDEWDNGIIGWGSYWPNICQTNALRLAFIGVNGIVNYWWGNDLWGPTGSLPGSWHHVAATWDGSVRAIYQDGTCVAAEFNSCLNVPSTDNFRIGCTNFTEYFSGLLDEVAVYDEALDQSAIQSYMNNGYGSLRPLDTKEAVWHFDEGNGSTLSDARGNHPATLHGGTWTTGQRGMAVDFNGTSDYAEANPGPMPTGAITIVANIWIDSYVSWSGIAERYGNDLLDCWALCFNDFGRLLFAWNNHPPWGFSCISDSAVPTGRWVQVAVASNGTTATFYIDGVADGTFPVGAICTQGTVLIGTNLVGGDEYFDGKIDELQIFDRWLTQAEIQALM